MFTGYYAAYNRAYNLNSAGHNLPIVDHPALTAFIRPAEEIRTVTAENTPIANNNAATTAEKVFPMESSIPIFKSPVSGWNFVGSGKGEALQGGPFTSKDLVLGTDSASFASLFQSLRNN